MKTFKFGQLLPKEDICDREEEIKRLNKICGACGRAIVYGPRRFGKTSVVRNAVLADFLESERKSIAIYADLFQLDSMEDASLRLQVAVEHSLSQRAGWKTFVQDIQNYLRHFRIEIALDEISGAPSVTLAGKHSRDEKSLGEIFLAIKSFSVEYRTLLVLDEFQDIGKVRGLEALFRSEIQALDKTAVVLLGSKKHILRGIFHDESRPFYGFGTDIEFGKIERRLWLPYMRERFSPCGIDIGEEGVVEICNLMRDVPNSMQELCQWIAMSDETGPLSSARIHEHLASLIENKSSRFIEKLAFFSAKEKKVLLALAQQEPVSSITSTRFLQATRVSATATKATVLRLTDYGILDFSEEGYWIADPIFRLFLLREFGGTP